MNIEVKENASKNRIPYTGDLWRYRGIHDCIFMRIRSEKIMRDEPDMFYSVCIHSSTENCSVGSIVSTSCKIGDSIDILDHGKLRRGIPFGQAIG